MPLFPGYFGQSHKGIVVSIVYLQLRATCVWSAVIQRYSSVAFMLNRLINSVTCGVLNTMEAFLRLHRPQGMNAVDSLMKLLNSPGAELSLCLGLLEVSSSQCR
jgi:hypothetical protein